MRGPLLDALRDSLHPDVQRRSVRALTDATSGQSVSLKITSSPDVLVVCPDDLPAQGLSNDIRRFPFLKVPAPSEPRRTACCDFLIFCQLDPAHDGPLFVLLTELKRAGAKGSRPQIENGCLLSRDLLAVTRHHDRRPAPPTATYFRGVVFTDNVQLPRPPTGRQLTYAYNRPEPDGLARLRTITLPRASNTHVIEKLCAAIPQDNWPIDA